MIFRRTLADCLRRSVIMGAVAVLAVSARAAETAPADTVIRDQNATVVEDSPGTDGVFAVQDNGDILHLQSGLRCPASFPNLTFWHAEVFSPEGAGTDVGCDYGRANSQGYAVSKLTIFVTRTGETLDQAFARYQGEITGVHPDSRYIGPALAACPKDADSSSLADFRSAEYEIWLGGDAFTSDLIVAVRAGWVLEVRATYRVEPPVARDEESIDEIGNAPGDRTAPAAAFRAAIRSIGSAAQNGGKPGR